MREYNADVPKVCCEWSKIQQVALNILTNGAQAMAEDRPGKKKEGFDPRFILRVMFDGEMACIEIEDNGPGMDEKTRKRVFEPFLYNQAGRHGYRSGLVGILFHYHREPWWYNDRRILARQRSEVHNPSSN